MNWVPEYCERTRGRPQKTWHMIFSEDLHGMGLTCKGAKITNSGGVSLPDVLMRTGGNEPESSK